MGDSADENEHRDMCEGVDLTGFLFGNIDETGQLESDVFDSESQKHLSSLGKYVFDRLNVLNVSTIIFCRLGLNSLLKEMIGEEKVIQNDSSDSDYESQETEKSQSSSNDASSYEMDKNVNSADGTIFFLLSVVLMIRECLILGNDEKLPSAVDYSDINELAEDEVNKNYL